MQSCSLTAFLVLCLAHSLSTMCCHPDTFHLPFVFCNTRDSIWKRKICLFEDKSKLFYSLKDAHSDCMIFSLSLLKISKFHQLWNSKRWMLLVMEKGFLHPTWRSGIDLRHVGDLQLCSGCNECLWFVRYSASNERGQVMLVIMYCVPWKRRAPTMIRQFPTRVSISNWLEREALHDDALCWVGLI